MERNSLADVLRFVAALLVVAGHTRELLFVPDGDAWWFYRLTGLGMPAVMVFFAVSGYSIASEAMHVGRGYGIGEFVFKRLTRLLVVLVPALFITAAFDVAGIMMFGAAHYGPATESNNFLAADRLTVIHLAVSLAFLQTFFIAPFGTNGPLWSLAMEFWCYIIFFLAVYGALQRRWAYLALALALFASLAVRHENFAALVLIWTFGAVARYLRVQSRVATYIFLGLTGYVLVYGPDMLEQWSYYIALGAVTALTLWGGSLRMPAFLSAGAGMTYSLYAVHYPLIVFVQEVIGGSVLRPGAKGYVLFAACALGVVIFSYLFARLTEARTGKVRRLLGTTFSTSPRRT